MKNILTRGGIEFLAVFLGIALSLYVDEWREENQIRERLIADYHSIQKDLDIDMVTYSRDFFEDDAITILITKNSVEKIRLNYTFSSGVKNFMKPHYFHHQTNFEHEHSQYRFNYKD